MLWHPAKAMIPVISFEEKAKPEGDDSELDDIDQVPFW